jgi:hypothetical protein
MSSYPKIYIGPMSKNIVDEIITFSNETNNKVGLIPSRRQIEFDGGYVNNWVTEDFSLYVRSKSKNIILQRDHAGAGQGAFDDNGFDSLRNDAWNFDLIHVDPWKKYPDYKEGLRETADMIAYASGMNPNLRFEIGTEESIRKFEADELHELLTDLHFYLGNDLYKKVVYLVIQSGTSLSGTTQTGYYDKKRLQGMVNLCRKHKILSKEHNGDYMSINVMKEKFSLGLDAINIAPEFGVLETKVYLRNAASNPEVLEDFYQICLKSKKWEKWVYRSFKPEDNKLKLIEICGHYVLSYPEFLEKVKSKMHLDIDNEIKLSIRTKLNELYGI